MASEADRRHPDEFFTNLVRYGGFVLVFLVTALIAVGRPEVAAGYVPAMGMILYKTVKRASETMDEGEGVDTERWSHLP